jgi:hypothetical protein
MARLAQSRRHGTQQGHHGRLRPGIQVPVSLIHCAEFYHQSTIANPDHRNNEIFDIQRINPQTGALQIPYDTPEEYTSFANLLIQAERLLLGLEEYQEEVLLEQESFEEADAFLEAEKQKYREEMEAMNAQASVSVEKGILYFAKSCFQ